MYSNAREQYQRFVGNFNLCPVNLKTIADANKPNPVPPVEASKPPSPPTPASASEHPPARYMPNQ
jgi:hypothetical protein